MKLKIADNFSLPPEAVTQTFAILAKLTKDQIAERTPSQYEPNGGGFNNAIGRLRKLELANGYGEIRANENLFQ